MQRGELYLVRKPGSRDPKKQRVFALMSRQVVIDSKSVVRYRGRIDDNPNRTKVIRNDLTGRAPAPTIGTRLDEGPH